VWEAKLLSLEKSTAPKHLLVCYAGVKNKMAPSVLTAGTF